MQSCDIRAADRLKYPTVRRLGAQAANEWLASIQSWRRKALAGIHLEAATMARVRANFGAFSAAYDYLTDAERICVTAVLEERRDEIDAETGRERGPRNEFRGSGGDRVAGAHHQKDGARRLSLTGSCDGLR